jgi:single-strand DNA-binding protein
MADINHVVLVGRLTRDAELKYTANGQAVCKFSIAVNRRRKNGDQWEDEANYFDIVLWGRQGEALNQYMLKGKSVGVEGELKQDRWQQDGQNRSKVEIVANNIQLLGSGSGGGGSSGGFSGGSGSGSYGSSPQNGNSGSGSQDQGNAGDDDFHNDIPF